MVLRGDGRHAIWRCSIGVSSSHRGLDVNDAKLDEVDDG